MRSFIAYRAPHSGLGTIQNTNMHLASPHMQCQHPLQAADSFMYLICSKPALYPSFSLLHDQEPSLFCTVLHYSP